MISINSKLDFPIITLLTAVLFINAYCFKVGEAIYFGYPTYYINLDLTSVINISLKLLIYFFTIIGSVVHFFGNDGKLKAENIKYLLWVIIALTVLSYIYNIRSGKTDPVIYLNGGVFGIASWFTVYISSGMLTKKEGALEVNFWALTGTAIVMAISSFLAGVNYHNQFASSLWETEDKKLVVGEFSGLFILKECKDGKGIFYLKEIKDSKFVEVINNVEQVSNPRCYNIKKGA